MGRTDGLLMAQALVSRASTAAGSIQKHLHILTLALDLLELLEPEIRLW